ncbi:MAG: hypothetical protein MUP21_06710 [Dehalococcoidia bacterium]|nr:hypothetical protein [Dehalococcoidia bacterium]
MSIETPYLQLIKPGFNEFRNSWNVPANSNSDKIDTWAQAFGQEIIDSRFSLPSLSAFLAVALNADGTAKPSAEVVLARSSPVYGFETAAPVDYSLSVRIDQGDWEVYKAREGQVSLRSALAFRMPGIKNQVFDGSKDANGYPSWMGFIANKAQVDGSVDPLMLTVDGFMARGRTLQELTLSGGAGIKYVYASFQADGVETVDGDATVPPPATPAGTVSNDIDGNAVYFSDATKDFTTENVQPGDFLTLIDSVDAGVYVIKTVAPGAVVDRLEIVGLFPTTGLSSINYSISDPLAFTLGFDTAEVPAAGKFYIGEADYDGAAVTAVRARHFGDAFTGEWRAVDVTGPTTFEEIYLHKLGSDALDFSVQVSQTNDGTGAVEELTLATMTSTLGVTVGNGTLDVDIVNTIDYTAAIFNPGTSDASYTPGSLTGDVTGSLTGAVTGSLTGSIKSDRSVAVKWNRNQIWIKNAEAGIFYKDYGGTVQTSGFIRVVARKRG